jgi:signal transduction histidine kinase/CheY-like chemotaxis protein
MIGSVSMLSNEVIFAEQQKRFPDIKFSEPLESLFREYRHERVLRRVPIIALAGLSIFLVFAILDLMTLPEPAYIITTAIRIFLICPLIGLALVASHRNWPINIYNLYYMSAYVISGIAVIAIIYTARINQHFLPYDGILLHLVFGYFLMGMPYTLATLGASIISITFFIMEYYLNTPTAQLASYAFFIITLNLMGLMGSYMQERSRRALFLNEQLVELAKKKDQEEISSKTRLVATASHDLRQPLHAMNLLIETLESRLEPSVELGITQKLKESTRQLSQLLGSLLNISRLNAGIVEPNLHSLDLEKILTKLTNEHIARASQFDLKLICQGPRPCLVNSDTILLERIIRNLFENAFVHANATTITLSWQEHQGKIRIEFKDDGKGIDEHALETIFEEFSQLAPGHNPGMGLGLAIVKQLSELLHLNYGVHSKLESGTCFWFDIPSSKQAPTTVQSKSIDSKQMSECNILLIDDDVNILTSMRLLLENWKYNVASCQSQAEVWEKINTFATHLIISDYRFPDTEKNGLALIHEIRQKTGQVLPAILITADTHSDVKAYLEDNLTEEEKAMTQITIKPVSPAKLRMMIQHYMADA